MVHLAMLLQKTCCIYAKLGIETGVDLELLAKAGWMISDELQRQPTSKVSQALRHRME